MSRPLRIVHVVHDYFPAIGGSEHLFQRVGEGLAAHGMDVSVVTSTARRTSDFIDTKATRLPAGVETINDVRVRRLEYIRLPRPARTALSRLSSMWTTHHWPGYGWLKSAWVGPHLPGLVREIVRLRPDVIAATAAPFMPLYRAATAARRLGIPLAIMPCLHPGDSWLLDNPSLFRLMQRAEGLLTLTPYEAHLLRAMGVASERLHLLGGGVSPQSLNGAVDNLRQAHGIAPDQPLVLFCGRMEEAKGVQTVVEAMARLWQQGSGAALALIGAATEYSSTRLTRLLSRLPAEWKPRVIVRNDVTEAEKWGWYQTCDVLAHPSSVESFGLVYLEAWLCGKPVIGGRTGPQSAVIAHGRDGLLVRPGAVEELAAALRTLTQQPVLARTFGAAGRAKVYDQHTWNHVIDRAAAIYHHLVELSAQPGRPVLQRTGMASTRDAVAGTQPQ